GYGQVAPGDCPRSEGAAERVSVRQADESGGLSHVSLRKGQASAARLGNRPPGLPCGLQPERDRLLGVADSLRRCEAVSCTPRKLRYLHHEYRILSAPINDKFVLVVVHFSSRRSGAVNRYFNRIRRTCRT